MVRIQITEPEHYIFKHSLSVRITDLNYGAHTGNEVILKFMHEARMNFLRSLGINDEIKIFDDVGLIVADAAIVYKSETFFDDTIVIMLSVEEHHKFGFDIYYHLINDKSKKDVAIGKTGIVFFDYRKRKIATAPQDLVMKIKALPLTNKNGNNS